MRHPYKTISFMMGILACGLTLAGCPLHKAECAAAADCGALVPNANPAAPSAAPRYCEGGKCLDAPAATSALTADLTMPRGLALLSIRYAVVAFHGANVEHSCKGRPNCPAETITCEDLLSQGLNSARFNVALGGVKGTDTQNGTNTFFLGVPLGNAPQGSQFLVVEGLTGVLGAGDRVAWYCNTVNPAGATTQVTATLLPPPG